MKIVPEPSPCQSEAAFFEKKLLAFNASQVNGYAYENVGFKAVDGDAVVAGIHGQIGGGWLYIVSLWVEADYRGRGLGRQLLETAEETALAKHCHGAYLYTYSFQSPQFYEGCGYRTFGKLDKFCGPHAKYFMKKALIKR